MLLTLSVVCSMAASPATPLEAPSMREQHDPHRRLGSIYHDMKEKPITAPYRYGGANFSLLTLECQALSTFAHETHFAGWATRSPGWLETRDCCGWYGVACRSDGSVRALRLRANMVKGALNTTLGALVTLEELDLSSNMLSGPLAPLIEAFANSANRGAPPARLALIDLHDNQLFGGLPRALARLPALASLRLDHNALDGPLPPGLLVARGGETTPLRELNLRENLLSGTLEPLLLATEFRRRRRRLAGRNHLSIFGDILSGLGDGEDARSKAKISSAAVTKARWELPASSETLSIFTEDPAAAPRAAATESATLLVASTAASKRPLTEAQRLATFAATRSADETMDARLAAKAARGELPPVAWAARRFRARRVRRRAQESNADVARDVAVAEALTADAVPPAATGVAAETLAAAAAAAPPTTRVVGGLTLLDLGSNALSGTLPVGLAPVLGFALTFLDLSNNAFTGTIPGVVWSEVSKVATVALGRNRLSGTIPPLRVAHVVGGRPAALSLLRLSSNALSGVVPPSLFHDAPRLKGIWLDDNQLTGGLPQTLGVNNPLLTFIYVQGNKLSGPVPRALGSMTSLSHLDLSANEFTTLPTTICDAAHASVAKRAPLAGLCKLHGNAWSREPSRCASLCGGTRASLPEQCRWRFIQPGGVDRCDLQRPIPPVAALVSAAGSSASGGAAHPRIPITRIGPTRRRAKKGLFAKPTLFDSVAYRIFGGSRRDWNPRKNLAPHTTDGACMHACNVCGAAYAASLALPHSQARCSSLSALRTIRILILAALRRNRHLHSSPLQSSRRSGSVVSRSRRTSSCSKFALWEWGPGFSSPRASSAPSS